MSEDCTNWTPKKWWPRFFEKFAELGMVGLAAKAAGVSKSLVYQYRRNSAEFAAQWEEAEELAISVLEDVATKRAINASDTLVIFLLKTRARKKYGDVIKNEHTGADGEPLRVVIGYDVVKHDG